MLQLLPFDSFYLYKNCFFVILMLSVDVNMEIDLEVIETNFLLGKLLMFYCFKFIYILIFHFFFNF